jgi:hypothetical protein
MWIIGGVTAVALVVALVVAIVSTSGDDSAAPTTTAATPSQQADVVAKVTSGSGGTIEGVGIGTASRFPAPAQGTPLTKDGKPEVLYIGAEYCPYCATARWSLVVALSRFGTFSNLGLTYSSSSDVFASTPTFTFHGATYTSQYLTFTGVETATREGDPLEKLTADQQAVYAQLNPKGGIPFIDFAGRYVLLGVNLDPQVLQDKSHEQIATALSDPSTDVAKAVLGAANTYTAAICRITNNQPATVCTAPIQALADQMDKT